MSYCYSCGNEIKPADMLKLAEHKSQLGIPYDLCRNCAGNKEVVQNIKASLQPRKTPAYDDGPLYSKDTAPGDGETSYIAKPFVASVVTDGKPFEVVKAEQVVGTGRRGFKRERGKFTKEQVMAELSATAQTTIFEEKDE